MTQDKREREENSSRNPSSQSVMKPVYARGFGPGHPRCRSSPHSHRRLLLGHPVMHPFDQYCLRGIDARAPLGIVRPARRMDGWMDEYMDRRSVGRLVVRSEVGSPSA